MSPHIESALDMHCQGGPELLRMITRPMTEPGAGQLRLRIGNHGRQRASRDRRTPAPFHADLAGVFTQLARGAIDRRVQDVMPLCAGPAALARLAAGDVHGKRVLTS